jgi:hypothetical protein
MEDDPKFTLFWRTGAREVVQGRTVAEAMTLAGYGGGAARALDFWAHGDNHTYAWDAATREWNSVPTGETTPPRP